MHLRVLREAIGRADFSFPALESGYGVNKVLRDLIYIVIVNKFCGKSGVLPLNSSWAELSSSRCSDRRSRGFSEVCGVTSARAGRGGAGSGARRLAPADCPYRYVLSVARRARWTRYERAARDPTARPSRNRKQITTNPVSNAPYACVKPHFVPTSTYVI
ncbi:unnamed protein product [Spodoptera exigua]|nr:unnamed protein product [Spodoptera exigua]